MVVDTPSILGGSQYLDPHEGTRHEPGKSAFHPSSFTWTFNQNMFGWWSSSIFPTTSQLNKVAHFGDVFPWHMDRSAPVMHRGDAFLHFACHGDRRWDEMGGFTRWSLGKCVRRKMVSLKNMWFIHVYTLYEVQTLWQALSHLYSVYIVWRAWNHDESVQKYAREFEEPQPQRSGYRSYYSYNR